MSEDKDLELGFQIEKELDELYASGKREFEVDELETNRYRLIEVEGEENFIFKLTKK
jgi:hypothetical protein